MVLLNVLLICSACSISRPCSEGGDVSWNPSIRGDRRCQKVQDPSGRYVNHGKFVQTYQSGKLALEGEFLDGKRNGTWVQYDEKGDKVMERYFDHGVEKAVAAPLKAQ
ncbi:hypothetical protein WDW86_02935 [Bdellovibrionota bacterium FG-2]